VTPGSALTRPGPATATAAASSASISATTAATMTPPGEAGRTGLLESLIPGAPMVSPSRQADQHVGAPANEARCAGGKQHHQRDQHDAVHDRRRTRRVGVVLRPERQELDQDASGDDAEQRAEPANDDADEEEDGQVDRERVRVDEVRHDHVERSGNARVGRADPERERLVAGEAHTRRDGRGLAVAHGSERPADPAAQEQPADDIAEQRDRPDEVVQPVVEAERMAEEVDRAQRSGQLGLAEEVLARATAGEVLELLDHRRRRDRGERYSQTPHLSHTRFTAVLPNSPDGRSSSTTRITASAAGSRRSAPMKST